MSIGNMRNRLELQAATRTSDQGGGSSIAWTKVATVFASITPQSSNEAVFADKLRDALRKHGARSYRTDLTTANRLVQTYRRDGNGVQTTRTFTINGRFERRQSF